MEKVKLWGKNKFFLFGIITLCYFILQLKFVNDAWFGTDELDIMVLGKGIAKGKLLYVDIFSQHMPFSYYISALFYKLGAVSVTEQRIAFYIFFAIIWTSIVFIYSNKIDYRVLLLYPFIHCCLIQNYDMGTTILSEHLAGCGAVILLLEFLAFCKEHTLGIRSYIMISMSIVLTFGTIFVAIYALFFMGIGVLFLEINWKIKVHVTMKKWSKYILKKYIPLVISIAIPWVVLLTYYIYVHSLSEFIYGAYTINRELYPKYNGGLGSNILSTFFLPIEMLASFFTNGFNISEWNYAIVLQWIVILCSIIYFYKLLLKEGKLITIILFLYIFALGVRGIFNFHGTACVEVLAFMVSYVFITYGYGNSEKFKEMVLIKQTIFVSVVIIVFSGYFNNVSKITTISLKEQDTVQSEIIKCITDDDEGIWMLTFDNLDAMLSDRVPIGAAPTTPWTWEEFGKREFKKLKKNPPRVAIFDGEHEVWGNTLKTYAPNVVKYIKKNYVKVPETTTLYVRNDYYDEVCAKIEECK